MHRLKFHGYSDDTFGEYGETGQDLDNYGSLEPVQCVIDCGEQGRLMVIGRYSKASLDNGCWMVGVSKVEEYDDSLIGRSWRDIARESSIPRSLLSRFRTAFLNLSGTKTE